MVDIACNTSDVPAILHTVRFLVAMLESKNGDAKHYHSDRHCRKASFSIPLLPIFGPREARFNPLRKPAYHDVSKTSPQSKRLLSETPPSGLVRDQTLCTHYRPTSSETLGRRENCPQACREEVLRQQQRRDGRLPPASTLRIQQRIARRRVIPIYFELIHDSDNEPEEKIWEWMCRTLSLPAEELVRARLQTSQNDTTPIQL